MVTSIWQNQFSQRLAIWHEKPWLTLNRKKKINELEKDFLLIKSNYNMFQELCKTYLLLKFVDHFSAGVEAGLLQIINFLNSDVSLLYLNHIILLYSCSDTIRPDLRLPPYFQSEIPYTLCSVGSFIHFLYVFKANCHLLCIEDWHSFLKRFFLNLYKLSSRISLFRRSTFDIPFVLILSKDSVWSLLQLSPNNSSISLICFATVLLFFVIIIWMNFLQWHFM